MITTIYLKKPATIKMLKKLYQPRIEQIKRENKTLNLDNWNIVFSEEKELYEVFFENSETVKEFIQVVYKGRRAVISLITICRTHDFKNSKTFLSPHGNLLFTITYKNRESTLEIWDEMLYAGEKARTTTYERISEDDLLYYSNEELSDYYHTIAGEDTSLTYDAISTYKDEEQMAEEFYYMIYNHLKNLFMDIEDFSYSCKMEERFFQKQ